MSPSAGRPSMSMPEQAGLTPDPPTARGQTGLVKLSLLSVATGAATGLTVGFFRLALERADWFRSQLVSRLHEWPALGLPVLVTIVAAATALAAWLVLRSAQPASGSGIPHVEAVINRELPPAPLLLFPVKFVGGLLSIGAGLTLGREGPSVQMGGNLGFLCGDRLRVPERDRLALVAAGAGAGLAAAFNAPIAGAVFVLEELVRRFDARLAVTALGASSSAIAVARVLVGSGADFDLEPLPHAHLGTGLLFAALGIVAGFTGAAYNRSIVGACGLAERFTLGRPVLPAAAIGCAVGGLAWFAPSWVGGGDSLTQECLSGNASLATLLLVFALRFLLGPVSYAAGTPGGLFAPMLVLGAQLGMVFGLLSEQALGGFSAPPVTFAVVGMAALFTAVVRAPVTGIILTMELTAGFNQLLPMLWACFAAMAVPTLLGNAPVYDSLKARMVRPATGVARSRRI